jgi:excinuclease ABC subunit C
VWGFGSRVVGHDEGMLPAVARLPTAPGVYRFRGAGGRVLYVGRAVDLRRRVASYWSELRDRRHLTAMVARIERVEAVVCGSAHEAAWLERNLLEERLPPWNRSRGEEVPVYIRVDGRPRSPGVAVVHRVQPTAGVHHYGPYLGSVRAQLAVAALDRVLPLAYTADGLAGSWADLRRLRGVDETDRESLLQTLQRVLDRDPDVVGPVRSELASRRTEAACALAYERAGQIQAELEALQWLVSEQKVTSAESVSLDVAGWADGVLVVFRIRQGRLSSWTQRRCTEAAAHPSLEATPATWVQFAAHNARLGAALAR